MQQMQAQLASSEKHWASEQHVKGLEERLLLMRLEEAESKLSAALLGRRRCVCPMHAPCMPPACPIAFGQAYSFGFGLLSRARHWLPAFVEADQPV